MTPQDLPRLFTSPKVLITLAAKLALAGYLAFDPDAHHFIWEALHSGTAFVTQFLTVADGEETSLVQWLAIAFTTVFVAEMGDKTQLATMLMSAQGKSPWSIFIGSASALVAASLVSVTIGGWISTLIPPSTLQTVAGVSFVLLGLYVLWAELTGEEEEMPEFADVAPEASESTEPMATAGSAMDSDAST